MATPTINDLYLKYTSKVGKTLENDRYFQYLYAMVESSENVFQHTNQVLHKVVDERWLSTIEDCLNSINKIIDKPRRFIETKEEVVPVALAKKITADSVRHLSMNTQFIASDENGDVQPTKVLNITVDESYDLYENRFIYHLIQRLVTFIDKRTDVIFWSTGDETKNTMKFESTVNDGYEQIEYKLEMSVKNLQSYMENDSDNMAVFQRIDHVRRLVMSLRRSSFCDIMNGCSKVRSPIQRTNLMMKDPDYRNCYRLWQFLESYDEVGYTIDVQESAIDFDEEYLIQMYTNLITNYTVFKSILESDARRSIDVPKRHRKIKPKFVKRIQEEFVDNRDIEDVEIRKVFVEEVTEAQLAAEAEAAELSEALMVAEGERDEALAMGEQYQMQIQMLNQTQIDLEEALQLETEAKEKAISERDAQMDLVAAKDRELTLKQSELEQTKAKALENINAKEEELQAAIAKAARELAEAEARLNEAKAQAAKEILEKQTEVDEAIKARDEAELRTAEVIRQGEETQAALKREATNQLARERNASDARLKEAELEFKKEKSALEAKHRNDIEALKLDYEGKLSAAKVQSETELISCKNEYENRIKTLDAEHTERINRLTADYEQRVVAINSENEKKLSDVKEDDARKLKASQDMYESKLSAAALEHEKNIEKLKAEHAGSLKSASDNHALELAKLNKEMESKLNTAANEKEALKAEYEDKIAENDKENERRLNLVRMNLNDVTKSSEKLAAELSESKAEYAKKELELKDAEAKIEKLSNKRGFFRRNRNK